jgi:hypothetical protein
MWVRTVLRILMGLIVSYISYLPVLLIVEYASFGRLDMEKAFYALYSPLEAPFLFLPSTWRNPHIDEIILEFIGGTFLIAGAAFSVRRGRRSGHS